MSDPYVDPVGGALRNRLGITDASELEQAEGYSAYLAEIRLYVERPSFERYDLAALQAVHRRLFRDIYAWAGELRSVNIVKGNAPFARVQHLRSAAEEVFARLARDNYLRGLDAQRFASGAGRLLADINALHPFREGNGRAQRAFLQLLSNDAGYQLRWADVDPAENIAVSEAAMADPDAFVPLISRILVPAAALLSPGDLRLAREDPPGLDL